MKRIKKQLALLLASVLLLTAIPIGELISYASDDITVSKIEYVRQHAGYQFESAGITITGQNLDKSIVEIFDTEKNIWVTNYGTRVNIGTQRVTISFTSAQAEGFSGRVAVHTTAGVREFDLKTASFPVIQAGTPTVNVDRYPANVESNNIVLTGTNLNRILTPPVDFGTMLATFGRNEPEEFTAANFQNLSGKWQIIQPNPGPLGQQDINLQRTATTVGVEVVTRYFYRNAFRTLRDTNIEPPIELFPNTGTVGSDFYIRAAKIPGVPNNYAIYFLSTLEGTDTPRPANRAQIVSIAPDRNANNQLTGKDLLIAKVPTGIGPGPYNVVIMDMQGTQIVAETLVGNYTVVETGFNPVIRRLSPSFGADTGATTDIIGDYLLTLRIPGITGGTPKPNNLTGPPAAWGSGTQTLNLIYDNTFLYNGNPITSLTRTIKAIVGGEVTFEGTGDTPAPRPSTGQGQEERIPVRLQGISDAATNPFRDAVLNIETTIVSGGVTYRFIQQVSRANAYEFIPRTYEPEVTAVDPDVIQIKNTTTEAGVPLNQLANDVLISIKGKNFFVDRYVDPVSGELITRYPSILIKTGTSDSEDIYELAFLPNENGGIIQYKDPSVPGNVYRVLRDADNQPVRFQLTVLNNQNKIVNGVTGNELGTKILIRMPEESLITLAQTADVGLKRLQVVNPSRESTAAGGIYLTDEILTFVRTADVPVIQRVTPSVVTVQGNEDIEIIGSNFREGMKLYLDGEAITNFTRERDISGGNDIVRFKAPPGREGVTQIAIVNPSGGMAVHNFTYVASFQADPVITNFAPTQGTPGTLVVINGRNFVIADPSVPSEFGIDGFRLIGTRVFLDGKDVNKYKLNTSGEIEFQNYVSPNAENLITIRGGQAAYSFYKDNVTMRYQKNAEASRVVTLLNDKQGRPAIDVGTGVYSLRYEGAGVFAVYNGNGSRLDTANIGFTPMPGQPHRGTTTITFDHNGDAITLTAEMDNRVMRVTEDVDGRQKVVLATFAESIQFEDIVTKERFTISYNFLGEVILSDNKTKIYTLVPHENGSGRIMARESSGAIEFIPSETGGTINRTVGGVTEVSTLRMRTPFEVNLDGRITGHMARVLNSSQIAFEVPVLTTGRGFKDLMVINPDTKNDSKTGQSGFLYIPQASSNPIISEIRPSKGSVDGGYYVTITGSDFRDDIDVFIDSVRVPRADISVSLAGDEIRIKMPKSIKNLNIDFGVDSITVPVVVLNPDGGSDSRLNGFTYIIPKSSPVINTVMPNIGSANGGEFVDILGDEFRFFEPYENKDGGPYTLGDDFEDLNVNGEWDNLLTAIRNMPPGQNKMDYLVDRGLINRHPLPESPDANVQFYYTSPILPTVYFGNKEARIVEIDPGFIRVITPAHPAGKVEVYVINNDSGVSNKKDFTFRTTTPKVNRLVPNFGRRQGQEPKDLFGQELYTSVINGYTQESLDGGGAVLPLVDQIGHLEHVAAWVRFGEIDNRKIDRVAPNSGLIINQRTLVNLDGGLSVEYVGTSSQLIVKVNENNKQYTRTFVYDGEDLLVPLGMLRSGSGATTEYYVPFGYNANDKTSYQEPYEYVRVSIEDRRLFVERGYAPRVTYNNSGHVTARTPSYHTIGTVPMTFTNRDGGKVTVPFTYTNPASEPKIFKIEPQEITFDQSRYHVYSAVQGGIDIEIIGTDFRRNVEVFIGGYKATVKELTTKEIGGVVYDLIVANVPRGTDADIDLELPVMVLNEDKGLATSSNIPDLIGPNFGNQTIPIYFVFKKPLSGPRIDSITPQKTSVAGGNTVTIIGSDFRQGAYVIIGTRAGIPIYNGVISERGTKLTFITPQNMTLGPKTVQVLNNDYGIAVRENGLTVVSAPTVSPVVLNTDGNPISRIHVTGGQEMILKGTGFQEGAKVYFGGEYLIMKPGENVPETEQGLFRDDSIRYVKNGIMAKSVQFIDSETLKITTPEVTFEGKVTVVVRNPDSGITDGNTSIEYTVPIPEDPTGLKVTTVDNYIKLYDYVAKNAQYFEIYVYIGTKTNAQLINNGYQDFSYLGITDIEPYKVIDLPGFDRMASADRIVFVLKAANKFGPSGYSNLAALTFQDVKDIDELGPPNLDGDLGVPKGQDHMTSQNGGVLQVDFAEKLSKNLIELDLTSELLRNTSVKRIVLPAALVRSGMNSISVKMGDSSYRFTPVTLNTQTFRTVAAQPNAYARITEDTTNSTARGYLTPNMRGKEQVSKVHSITFDASSNRGVQAFTALSGTLDFTIHYGSAGLTQAKELQLQLYKYNPRTNSYEPVQATVDRANKRVTARITESGHFVLMTNR